MVLTLKRDEPGAGNAGCHFTPGIEGHSRISSYVHHERGRSYLAEKPCDVEAPNGLDVASRAFRRCRPALQFSEGIKLFRRSSGEELRGPHLPECGVVSAPVDTHQGGHRRTFFLFTGGTFAWSERKPAVENKMRYAFRVTDRMGNRNGAALRYSKQRKAVDTGSVDNRLKISHPSVEGDLIDIPVGHAVAASIIADERVIEGQPANDVSPDRAFPIIFEVIQKVCRLDQRWSAAGDRIG